MSATPGYQNSSRGIYISMSKRVDANLSQCENCIAGTMRVCQRCGRIICRKCASDHWDTDDRFDAKREKCVSGKIPRHRREP
jgi:hypothetical protein